MRLEPFGVRVPDQVELQHHMTLGKSGFRTEKGF